MPTVVNTIAIAKVSQLLASNFVARQGLFGGGTIDPRLPVILYVERTILEKIYNADHNYSGLQVVADYVYALCGRFAAQASAILGLASGGSVAPPTPAPGILSPIKIVSGDFVDATNWHGANSAGVTFPTDAILQVYADSINQRFLNEGQEWSRTALGVEILLDGFDAQTEDYTLYIYIST
jgi:hypothetical protein